MTPLVFDHCDSNHGVTHDPKKYQIRKSPHQCLSRIPTDNHPTGRHSGNAENLPLKFVDEVITKIPGPVVVIIPDLSEFGFNSRVVLNPHCLKRVIKS